MFIMGFWVFLAILMLIAALIELYLKHYYDPKKAKRNRKIAELRNGKPKEVCQTTKKKE